VAGHYLYGGVKIPEHLRKQHATVTRTLPDGTIKYMFPIWDRDTADRALENINSAEPPLFPDELRAVIARATLYIRGRRTAGRFP
jgi:hypothetical protein